MKQSTSHWLMPLTTAVCIAGCHHCTDMGDITPHPLGTLSDSVWRSQESNAEASDFVIHEHEWIANSESLNDQGINHLMRITARIAGVPYPIVIEPSSQSVRQETTLHQFPIHNDSELDLRRRDVIVDALTRRNVVDSATRVLVGPATAPGFESFEGEEAYNRGFGGSSDGSSLGRGGLGGGGGGGGGGGFGGGGIF